MSFDYSSAGKRFASQNELLDCFADVLDLHIYYIYKYHYWVSPENSMQGMLGVVVTREEFEKGLLRASGGTAWESLSDDETSERNDQGVLFRKGSCDSGRLRIPGFRS